MSKHLIFILAALLFFSMTCKDDGKKSELAEIESEGTTSTPIAIVVGEAKGGQIGASGKSYYYFTSTTAGTYTIALGNLQSNLAFDYYNNSDFSSGLLGTCDDNSDNTEEICVTGNLSAATDYYLKVTELDGTAGGFIMLVNKN